MRLSFWNAGGVVAVLNWVLVIGVLVTGLLFGWIAAYVLMVSQRKVATDALLESVKANFGSLSLDALAKASDQFLELAKTKLESERQLNSQELDGKKLLIDQQLEQITAELEKVTTLVHELEGDRILKFGELTNQLKTAGEQTEALSKVTSTLREALTNSKVRGQWGERMAEDVLRVAGFVENVNYLKQKVIEGPGTRPDFTFLLPNNLKLNMDVKFPLDNYIKHLEANSPVGADAHLKDFLKDIKAKVKEVTSRDYINPAQNTLDYVLMFIPNEQIYGFIHEHDRALLDEAIKNKVVLCSPITLFAVLAVIRHAVDNFVLEQATNEILSLLGGFKKQWVEFVKKMEALGKRIEDASKEYDDLKGVRKRQLERPLEEIEARRIQKGLPIVPDESGNELQNHRGLEIK